MEGLVYHAPQRRFANSWGFSGGREEIKPNGPTYERKLGVSSAHLVDECDVSANGLDAIVNIERFASDIGKC